MSERSERLIIKVPFAHWCTARHHSVTPRDEMVHQ